MRKTEFSLRAELLPLGELQEYLKFEKKKEYLKFRQFTTSKKKLEKIQECSLNLGSGWEDLSRILQH